jgi:hypothetical protein
MKSHQRIIRENLFETDIKALAFDHSSLKASDFTLSNEPMSKEIVNFIKTYEWLGTIGPSPKWIFTARYNGLLGGVILINEPNSYSKIMGPDTRKYEALIQRGACASWTPKNLGSRLIMSACKWMVSNTTKRMFVAYADPAANEIGTLYQACNFEYLGSGFGVKQMLAHPSIGKGKPFSSQTLRRTSTLKKWAKEQGIVIEPSWIKPNGFKDLNNIPDLVKKAWYQWGSNIQKESKKIQVNPKGKYILVLGKDRKEQAYLNSLKKYQSKPYPKRKVSDADHD